MTFWPLTGYSDFPTDQTFHQFYDSDSEPDFHRITKGFMEHLQRVWHASRERLTFRIPGYTPPPFLGTCLCSNHLDRFSPTCRVFSRLFTFNTPRYFLDFASFSETQLCHWKYLFNIIFIGEYMYSTFSLLQNNNWMFVLLNTQLLWWVEKFGSRLLV